MVSSVGHDNDPTKRPHVVRELSHTTVDPSARKRLLYPAIVVSTVTSSQLRHLQFKSAGDVVTMDHKESNLLLRLATVKTLPLKFSLGDQHLCNACAAKSG